MKKKIYILVKFVLFCGFLYAMILWHSKIHENEVEDIFNGGSYTVGEVFYYEPGKHGIYA